MLDMVRMPLPTIRRLAKPFVFTGISLFILTSMICWHGAATRGLEYDEIWTLRRYARTDTVWKVFQDLATPNNHPLHSLLVRLAAGQPVYSELRVRLPSLLAMTALLVLLPLFYYGVTRDREITLLAGAWCASSAPLLHFAQTARGYELQTLLVLLFALLVYHANPAREHASGAAEGWLLVGAVMTGIAAMLTLPTSILYLAPLAVYDLVNRWMRWRRARTMGDGKSWAANDGKALTAHAVLAAFVIAWLWYGMEQFAAGQAVFGAPIGSVSEWLSFSGDIWVQLFGWPVIVLIACGLLAANRRVLTVCLLGVLCFPLLAAPLTRGGPSRVYVPMIPFGMLAAAIGFVRLLDFLRNRWTVTARTVMVMVVALAPLAQLPHALARWTPMDWREVVPVLQQRLPADAYINYPAAAGYVIDYYFARKIRNEISQRVPCGAAFTLVQVDGSNGISAVDPGSFSSLAIPVATEPAANMSNLAGSRLATYQADEVVLNSPAGQAPETGIYFAAIGPAPLETVRGILGALCATDEPRRWGVLNGLLSDALLPPPSPPLAVSVLLMAKDPKITRDEMQQMSERHGNKIRFYALHR